MFRGRKEMDSLKKELEEELKLSNDDLRSHSWYHGPTSREVLNSVSVFTPDNEVNMLTANKEIYLDQYDFHISQ